MRLKSCVYFIPERNLEGIARCWLMVVMITREPRRCRENCMPFMAGLRLVYQLAWQ